MAQYMILIYGDEAELVAHPEVMGGLLQEHIAYQEELGDARIAGNGLQPSMTATSLVAGAVTDGPYLETKEVLGGYYLIEAPDLDAALVLAKKCPQPFGGVEVRPVMVFD